MLGSARACQCQWYLHLCRHRCRWHSCCQSWPRWHLAASLAGRWQLPYLPLLGVATFSGMGMRPGPGMEAGSWPLSRCVPTRTYVIDGMIWIEEPEPGPEAGFPASRRFLTLRHSCRNRDPNEST